MNEGRIEKPFNSLSIFYGCWLKNVKAENRLAYFYISRWGKNFHPRFYFWKVDLKNSSTLFRSNTESQSTSFHPPFTRALLQYEGFTHPLSTTFTDNVLFSRVSYRKCPFCPWALTVFSVGSVLHPSQGQWILQQVQIWRNTRIDNVFCRKKIGE